MSGNIFKQALALPATAAENHDEDDEDGDDPGGDTHDDGQVLGADGVGHRVCEGQGDVAFCHATVVEGDAKVLSKVIGGH